MSLAESPRLRLLTLCLLYVAQGIPWGFMATTLPAILTERGVKVGTIGTVLAFTTLPYTFKWIWGPIIDTVTFPRLGRRRPWIVFAQSMMATTVFVLVAIPEPEVELLAWMVLIHTVFNALQDVAVDALAVDLLSDAERGRANGLMYGSKYLGGAVGGIVMVELVAETNLDTALVVQAAILLAIMMLPLLIRERPGEQSTNVPVAVVRPNDRVAMLVRSLAQAFSLRSTLAAALLILAGNFAIGMMIPTANVLFVGELGWKPKDYVAISGGWGLLIGCTCAAAAGFLSDRFGRRRVAAISSIALAAGWIAFALLREHWMNRDLAYAIGLYQGACQAIWSVALISMCMDLSWPKIGGSQFAAYMALSNFSTTLGFQFAERALELWEFYGVYIAAGVMQVVVTAFLIPIDPKQARRDLKDDSPIHRLGVGFLVALLVFLIGMTVRATLKQLGYI